MNFDIKNIKNINVDNNPLKDNIIKSGSHSFKLWLEFEETNPWDDVSNDFANIGVDLLDGRKYGISVWTYEYLRTATQLKEGGIQYGVANYEVPPDLFVVKLTRSVIEETISDLLSKGNLEEMLNETTFGLRFIEPWVDTYTLADVGESLKEKAVSLFKFDKNLKHTKFEVVAFRMDNDEVLVSFNYKNFAVLNLMAEASDSKPALYEYYHNEIDFWNRRMKNDIESYCGKSDRS